MDIKHRVIVPIIVLSVLLSVFAVANVGNINAKILVVGTEGA